MRLIIGALAAIAITTPYAHADFMDGNRLLEACEPAGSMSKIECFGYIEALADTIGTDGRNMISGWRACLPAAATAGQLIDVVTQELHTHPEERHYGAVSLVIKALASAFPCGSK